MMAILTSRALLIALGLILLAVVIWFAGPYIAFADYKPLESVVARLIAIIVIAIGYAVFVQLKQMKGAKASAKLADEVSKQDEKAGDRAASGDAAALRKRFDEAVEALRKSKKKSAANLYQLPWYMIIGPPGSGKTTVLVNSGLNFPLAQKFGKEAVRGVGGTRNCDWWFTDEAILLDTAGRYTTQDSNAKADAAGWTAFLQLLRKYRGRQPINGVIVAISASDLLTLNEREREHHVSALRERLDELSKNLKIDVPVYFLVTKCDLIAGFSEFFDDLGQDARAQVWGTTFGIDDTESGRAAEMFEKEYDRVIERLQQRVLSRMENERDARRRTSILAFPEQMAALKPLLNDLLKRVFSSTEYDSQILLRGVYFTSGTQEGTPVDRMLGAIARSFGFTSAVAPPAAGRGKAYFIERLLRNVVFHESGLAGVNRRVQLQKFVLQSAAYIACVAVLVFGVLALVVSYNANANYVDGVTASAKDLPATELGADVASLPLEASLPRLDLLRSITETAEQHRGDVPLRMRMGLYRGNSLGGAARDAYTRELNRTLPPVLGTTFEQQLQLSVAQPDRLYEYLKGYLMLGDDEHRDATHLRFLSDRAWSEMYPGDAGMAQRLGEHFQQVLSDDDDRLTSIQTKPEVVEQARFALRNARLPVLMFSRLKLLHADDTKRAVRLDLVAGTGAPLVLVRKSGKPLSEPVPALFTREVFNEFNSTGKYELAQQFIADAWVFDKDMFDIRQRGALLGDVLSVYEDEFIRTWDDVLKDVTLKPTNNPQELTEVLGVVSSPASPLKGLLVTVANNTDLLRPNTAPGAKQTAQAEKALAAKTAQLEKMFGGTPAAATKPGARVAAYFQQVRQLVGGAPGQAPIDQLLASLAQTHQQLRSIGSGLGDTNALDALTRSGQADALRNLQLVAKQLPGPVGEMVAQLGSQTENVAVAEARGDLARRYNEQVTRECRELVEGRYPISRSSGIDMPLGDFARVFGPGGVFETFFRENLSALVDTSRSPWRWREGAEPIGGSAGILKQFQAVQRIREVYFKPGSASPEARFSLTPDSLDATATRFTLDVDGQPFEYRHGPQQSRAIGWPGTAGQASFGFEDRGGPIPGLAKQGPWAWFRLLESAQVAAQSDTRFRITFTAGGKSMNVILEATSIRNPFGRNELAGFRCSM